MNFSNINVIKKLQADDKYINKTSRQTRNDFTNSFVIKNEILYRHSSYGTDRSLVNFLCKEGINGYIQGLLPLEISSEDQKEHNFMPEIMLCEPNKAIKLIRVHDILPYYCNYDIDIPIQQI